jgi:hypothetical protein
MYVVLFFCLDGFSCLVCSHSELIYEIIKLTDSRFDFFDGKSGHCKVVTYIRQQKQNKCRQIHAPIWIRTQGPSGQAAEDILCLIPRCHCDRHY